MVFIAFVLLTVSTLAVHGKEVSTDGSIIPRGCEGKSLCDEKPADYPQDEIDDFLQNNPAILRRMKRAVDLAGWSNGCKESEKLMPELEEGSVDGNCQTQITCEKPYLKYDTDGLPQAVVQSRFFSQEIRQVRCSSSKKEQCFRDFTREGPAATCKNKEISTTLFVYDRKSGKIKEVPGIIFIDCACELSL